MKGQDILLLLKLVCLSRLQLNQAPCPDALGDTGPVGDNLLDKQTCCIDNICRREKSLKYLYTVRGLSGELGISKSEVSNSLNRCFAVNLVKINNSSKKLEVNKDAFFGFIKYGFRYVFPVKAAEITRGIPTAFSAPSIKSKLLSPGYLKMIWPCSRGKDMGQAIAPLYRSVPSAASRDGELYSYLALLDAIRIGNARERNLALELFKERLFAVPLD